MKRVLSTLLASTAFLTSAALLAPAAGAATTTNYLALGDSYPAGVGLLSTQAYPAVLTATYAPRVSLTDNAQSGSSTTAVLGQITSYAHTGRRADVITLTAGADDVDWQGVLVGCLQSPTGCTTSDPTLQAAMAALPTRIAADVAAAGKQNPRAKIFVTGYPQMFDPFAAALTTCTIGTYARRTVTVSGTQAFSVNALVDELDAAIGAGVGIAAHNGADVRYVDATLPYLGHRLCNRTPWLQNLNDSAPFHPKAAGQVAYATAITKAGFGTTVTSPTRRS